MIQSHDEVELIDVLTLMEAVSSMAGSQITARMIADVHLAILWFHELADFSGNAQDRIKVMHEGAEIPWPTLPDWHWDGPLVLESLSSTNEGSLARRIYTARRFSRGHVKVWILSHENWRVK